MMMLAWLAVAFGGIVGNGAPEAGRIGKEIAAAMTEQAEIARIDVPAKKLAVIARHGSGSRDLVAALHVDGLVVGELTDKRGTLTLRLVVYGPDGGLRSLTEMTLQRRALSLDDFAAIRENLGSDVVAMSKAASKAAPKVAAKAEPKIAAKPAPAPEPEIDVEPEAPPPTQVAAADDAESPLETAAAEPSVSASAIVEEEDPDPVLGLKLGLGLGVIARNFAPGPSTVTGYSSSPVGSISLSAQMQPARRICLDALVDRTLTMSTPMGADTAATTMSRWEVSGDYTLRQGRISFAGRLGLGRRAFAIESDMAARTPDSDYNYLIVGATATADFGHHIVAHALAAFEPVLWGTEPTEMAFGEARRWAVDVGAAIEVRPREHVYARVAADLQRFAWEWTAAGARGAGGAVDLFPSATLSLGAVY